MKESNNHLNFTETLSLYPTKELWLVKSKVFSELCTYLKRLSNELYDFEGTNEENKAAIRFRIELAKLRFTVYTGNAELTNYINTIDKQRLQKVHGERLREIIRKLDILIERWNLQGSALNKVFLENFIKHVKMYGMNNIKVLCRTRDIELYKELLLPYIEVQDNCFITGINDYKKADFFNSLFYIGPFRCEGMSAFPEMVVTAPKYKELIRFCWDRVLDEESYGQDPIYPDYNYLMQMPKSTNEIDDNSMNLESFDTTNFDVELLQDILVDNEKDSNNKVNCCLIDLRDSHSVFLRHGHTVLTCKARSGYSLVESCSAKALQAGDFLLTKNIDTDLGENKINPSQYPATKIWKDALKDLYKRSPYGCVTLMKNAGIKLKDLYSAAENWADFEGRTLKAPQRKKDLYALVTKVLPQKSLVDPLDTEAKDSFFEKAWDEIREFRSAAIEYGQISQQLVTEQLLSSLNEIAPSLHNIEMEVIELPESSGLDGSVTFYKVTEVSTGYLIPDEMLGRVVDSIHSDRYRIGGH